MERHVIDCPVCGKPAWYLPVSPWYDCPNSLKHPQIKAALNAADKINATLEIV